MDRRLRLREEPDAYDFSESQLNRAGHTLLQSGRTADAVAVLALNVEMFPDGFNARDSLGEAYMTTGDIDRAIASYRRSVELNPENTNGIEVLARLKSMKDARTP